MDKPLTPEQERAEARKALQTIRDDWYVWDYPHGGHEIFEKESKATILTTFPTDGNGRFDGSFIAKLPTWLRNSLDREEQLERELKHSQANVKMAVSSIEQKDKEIQRLLKVEEDYKALQQIMERARRLAFLADES